MNFSNQKTVSYLINQFYCWLRISYIKTLAMLNYQQIKNNKSNKTVPKIIKYQNLDNYNNKKEENWDKYESKIKDKANRYILFF